MIQKLGGGKSRDLGPGRAVYATGIGGASVGHMIASPGLRNGSYVSEKSARAAAERRRAKEAKR